MKSFNFWVVIFLQKQQFTSPPLVKITGMYLVQGGSYIIF
jgi:hypothetical protein